MSAGLPTSRHFDCMKRCPMDCAKACKRLAYPRLVEALRGVVDGLVTCGPDHDVEAARALLAELGEAR